MPIVPPAGPTQFFFSDLGPEVILRTENRTTDLARAYVWLSEAVIELSTDGDLRDEFPQLEEYGNTVNLTVGQQEYDDISNFVPATMVNDATLDFLIWIDPPTNSKRKRLDYVSYQEADKFLYANAQPIQWYRFSNVIGFYPQPDQAYQVQPRIVQQHPINDSNLSATQFLLPRNWKAITILLAVMHGFIELEEYEKAGEIRKHLYGVVDPGNGKVISPGLIYRTKKQKEREGWRKEMILRPTVRPYSYGGR